jgi:hypothetical protein
MALLLHLADTKRAIVATGYSRDVAAILLGRRDFLGPADCGVLRWLVDFGLHLTKADEQNQY